MSGFVTLNVTLAEVSLVFRVTSLLTASQARGSGVGASASAEDKAAVGPGNAPARKMVAIQQAALKFSGGGMVRRV